MTADLDRLEELARDAARELAHERRDERRRLLLAHFVQTLAREMVSALQARHARRAA